MQGKNWYIFQDSSQNVIIGWNYIYEHESFSQRGRQIEISANERMQDIQALDNSDSNIWMTIKHRTLWGIHGVPFIQWNLSVTTTSLMKLITCDLFSNVF